MGGVFSAILLSNLGAESPSGVARAPKEDVTTFVVDKLRRPILSRKCLKRLHLIPQNFPHEIVSETTVNLVETTVNVKTGYPDLDALIARYPRVFELDGTKCSPRPGCVTELMYALCSLVEHGDDGSKLTIILIVKIVKFATRFFSNIENHIMEGSVPDSVPNFTPRDSNPKLLQAATIMSVVSNTEPGISKVKPESSPPGTPARDRIGKKQRVKPAPGSQDFSKAGLFHCKEGTPFLELFPANLEKKLCSFFCLHGKKCSKPTQVCEYEHIGKWEKIPANDQIKILEHCHATYQ